MFSTIRTAIIDKINSDDITKIQVAYRTDRSTLEGFPAAVVSPSENEADYATTASDRRVYAFKVRLYYPIKDGSEQDSADIALEEALDEMIDAFSTRDALGAACDWIEPVPSIWQYEERDAGLHRMAELTLRCITYKPNTP